MKLFWRLKQLLSRPSRYYGDGGTIHHSTRLDVEVDTFGEVVAVWFRCQPLPFRQTLAMPNRADEMRNMMRSYHSQITGVEIRDSE